MKLSKCFSCFYGGPCSGEKRLPRKKKKLLKKLMGLQLLPMTVNCIDGPSSCDLGTFWRDNRQDIMLAQKNIKHEPSVLQIMAYSRLFAEPVHIKTNMPLDWCYEHENGLYTEDGMMPFQYYDENDDTWAFEETKNLVTNMGFSIDRIQSDKDLIAAISKSSI